jgi:Fungal specific transcription factor domain
MICAYIRTILPAWKIDCHRHRIYFEKVHGCVPVIHRPRYLAAMDLAPSMRPPVCLRYAMWTHACSITPKYSALADHFYTRARKYAEQDEMRGFGEGMITIAHCQSWSLIATYEFKMMYFPRAWMSVGRATRLSQMMSLHRQDGAALDVKQALPPPRDWTEREERRRTFWMAFCQDRYASVGTGWPMTIDERDVRFGRLSVGIGQLLIKRRSRRTSLLQKKLFLRAGQRARFPWPES